MSRVGKKPIAIPAGVTVTVHPDRIDFEGPKGKLSTPLRPGITAGLEDGSLVTVKVERTATTKPVTASGVSAAKVVATMEVPASHQFTLRPETK